jgi:hypothetical protein
VEGDVGTSRLFRRWKSSCHHHIDRLQQYANIFFCPTATVMLLLLLMFLLLLLPVLCATTGVPPRLPG